jgi:hypothetical protein
MEQNEQAKACLKEIEEVLAKYKFNLVPTIQLFEIPEEKPVETSTDDLPVLDAEVVA